MGGGEGCLEAGRAMLPSVLCVSLSHGPGEGGLWEEHCCFCEPALSTIKVVLFWRDTLLHLSGLRV